MRRLIKNVKELPEWFHLSNYEGTKDLDLAGWYEQLHVRLSIIRLLLAVGQKPETESGLLSDPRLEIIEAVWSDPIVDLAENPQVRAILVDETGVLLNRGELLPLLGVRYATVQDLYTAEALIPSEKRNYARKFYDQLYSDDIDLFSEYMEPKDWMADLFGLGGLNPPAITLLATVDLTLPEDVLFDQFKNLIQAIKGSSEDRRPDLMKIRDNQLADWTKFAILPYLDLMTWSYAYDVKTPNRVLADAIFPAGEGGEEVVRKTTRRMANRLLQDAFQRNLLVRAAGEKAERNRP